MPVDRFHRVDSEMYRAPTGKLRGVKQEAVVQICAVHGDRIDLVVRTRGGHSPLGENQELSRLTLMTALLTIEPAPFALDSSAASSEIETRNGALVIGRQHERMFARPERVSPPTVPALSPQRFSRR